MGNRLTDGEKVVVSVFVAVLAPSGPHRCHHAQTGRDEAVEHRLAGQPAARAVQCQHGRRARGIHIGRLVYAHRCGHRSPGRDDDLFERLCRSSIGCAHAIVPLGASG